MIVAPLLCIFASFFVGYYGRDRKMGFWGYFFASLLLTPVLGLLLVIVSEKNKPKAGRVHAQKRAGAR